jgi:hypothetical protein
MKSLFKALVLSLVILSINSYAYTKCEKSPTGGVCCWDSEVDGPWMPIGC